MSKFKIYKISIIDLKVKGTGSWTIISEIEPFFKNGAYHRLLQCKCVCGKIKNVFFFHINNGRSKSCGCQRKCSKTHGLSNHPIYYVWSSMKARCYDKNRERYNDWGGRGIRLSDEWKNDFKKFYDWAICNGYRKGLQIDRIDNDGNYCS